MLKKRVTLVQVILIGHIIVSVPSLIIFIGTFLILMFINLNYFFCVISGAALGWFYWSYFIPRWRKWALEKGIDEEKLYKWGMLTLLTWKKGSIFEKTEFPIKKQK